MGEPILCIEVLCLRPEGVPSVIELDLQSVPDEFGAVPSRDQGDRSPQGVLRFRIGGNCSSERRIGRIVRLSGPLVNINVRSTDPISGLSIYRDLFVAGLARIRNWIHLSKNHPTRQSQHGTCVHESVSLVDMKS